MTYKTLQQAAELRRSIYVLNKDLPVSTQQINDVVKHAALHTPSSFNSQSSRLVVLHGQEHDKLWDLTIEALSAIVPAENFAPTKSKLNMFKAAAGTVLLFEDMSVIEGLQAQLPAYAENFPIWADHANAMIQYALWTTLATLQVGANLQHYNPVIDDAVAKTWNIPSNWKLRAQLVFGGIGAPAGEKEYAPIEDRFISYGA